MSTSVYKITNTVNGKVYFGKAADVWDRWYKHIWAARHGSPLVFHRAIRKYGPETFHTELVATYDDEAEANAHEIRLIASVPQTHRYNVAPGGNGGHTMSVEQLDAQYAIPPGRFDEFRSLFRQGMPLVALAKHFNASRSSINRCAKRLGLSFEGRREHRPPLGKKARKRTPKPPPTPKPPRAPKPPRILSRARYSPEERSRLQSERARQSNKARGISPEQKAAVLALYFTDHLTAQEVAASLGLTRGSVRATVNQRYREMTPEEHKAWKHAHGSAVRSGARNPNARKVV